MEISVATAAQTKSSHTTRSFDLLMDAAVNPWKTSIIWGETTIKCDRCHSKTAQIELMCLINFQTKVSVKTTVYFHHTKGWQLPQLLVDMVSVALNGVIFLWIATVAQCLNWNQLQISADMNGQLGLHSGPEGLAWVSEDLQLREKE